MSEAESRIFELKVGIFVAVGILIFFIIVFSIGDVYLIKKGYRVDIVFNFASGITESAPVRLAGVNVGQVEKVGLFFDEKDEKTKARLVIWIQDTKMRIEKDSKVVINTLGLLGEKYLEIFPGSNKNDILKDGDEIIGHDPVPTEELAEKAHQLTDSANVLLTRLKDGEGTIGKLLVEEKVYNDLEALMEDIKENPWKLLQKPKRGDK